MRGFNFNISSLFSGFGSGNAFSSFNFSDYASIKNGSYTVMNSSIYGSNGTLSSSLSNMFNKWI